MAPSAFFRSRDPECLYPSPRRLVFAGTPEFAVPCLDALLASGHEVCAVYTQPDRPAGRGRALAASPVKQRALAAGIEVRQPRTLRDAEAQAVLRQHGGDVAGNLLEKRFSDIWNGDFYRQIRRAFAQRRPGWHCTNCGMNWQKSEEHQIVPYDPESFLSRLGRDKSRSNAESPIRWSGRMKPFDLVGRRHGQ